MPSVAELAAHRRTFAIISHPDAGKTTLTEKFLLYGGAVQEAGAVKARGERRRARSDWMELEQKRGISITSTVLQFPYRDHVLNLLDTPGHRDFSEDTYRVLAAADAAVMVLDAAKGIEPQTLKLFEVCRARNVPLLTFVNKWDRPGRDGARAARRDRDAGSACSRRRSPGRSASPATSGALVDRRPRRVRPLQAHRPRRRPRPPRRCVDAERAAAERGRRLARGRRRAGAARRAWPDRSTPSCSWPASSRPVFVGSALTNFGVRLLLDGVVDLAPPPVGPRSTSTAPPASSTTRSRRFVFKVQANMDPSHRDRIAFVRVCSGRFERGMVVTHGPTGRPFATKYAHSVFGQERETVDEAYPGDVVGLVNATDVRVGDTLYVDAPVEFPGLPSFAPEHFVDGPGPRHRPVQAVPQGHRPARRGGRRAGAARPRPRRPGPDARRGRPDAVRGGACTGSSTSSAPPSSSAPTAYTVARRTDEASAPALRAMPGVRVLARADGTLLALFESPYWLARVEGDNPDLTLDRLVAEGTAG